MKSSAEKYGRLALSLHWISALLMLVLWPLGFIMARMGDSANRTSLYRVHVVIGLLILLLTIIRVIWHFVDVKIDPPPNLAFWNLKAFIWNHNLLYLFLLVMAASGIAMLQGSGVSLPAGNITPDAIAAADVPARSGHSLFSKVFLLLFLAHVGGVFRYQFTKGNVLARMGVNWFSKS